MEVFNMIDKNISKIIEKLGLLPVIPLSGYDKKPYVAWSIEQNIIKDINSINSILANNTYTYTTKEGVTKTLTNITGLALLTGTRSNIVVIDLDTHDSNSNGINSFDEYVQQNNITNIYNTFTVDTPTGGKHLYYKYSGNISSSAGILPGVDVRANGGLIVLPYTQRKVNEEILQYKVVKDIPIMELPQELIELCTISNNTINSNGTQNRTRLDLVDIWNNGIPDGERNDRLLRVGGRIRRNFNNIEDFAFCMLALNNNICVPPLDNDELYKICTYLWNIHINNTSNNYPYPYYYDEEKCGIFKKETKDDEDDEKQNAVLIYGGYINLVGRRVNIDTNEIS